MTVGGADGKCPSGQDASAGKGYRQTSPRLEAKPMPTNTGVHGWALWDVSEAPAGRPGRRIRRVRPGRLPPTIADAFVLSAFAGRLPDTRQWAAGLSACLFQLAFFSEPIICVGREVSRTFGSDSLPRWITDEAFWVLARATARTGRGSREYLKARKGKGLKNLRVGVRIIS